jgi:hypothetical protein
MRPPADAGTVGATIAAQQNTEASAVMKNLEAVKRTPCGFVRLTIRFDFQ